MLQIVLPVWLITQVASVMMLWLGSRIQEKRFVSWFGKIAHTRKLDALDRYWPLTLIRPAVERKEVATCTAILSILIAFKSAGCCLLGFAVVFWLPFASLLMPAIVARHSPGDRQLLTSVRRVAALQLTSHTLAAAVGFAIVAISIGNELPLVDVITSNGITIGFWIVGSLVFAVIAGLAETKMLLRHGL